MNARTTLGLVALAVLAGCASTGCASTEARFPLAAPVWRDGDLASVYARCHEQPDKKDPHHVSCAPEPYDSPLYWDGADNLFFRPLSDALYLQTSGESVDVNSMDEVPDSTWFQNRIGLHPMTPAQITMGACRPDQLLDPAHAAEGSWVIDKGKTQGWTPAFRVRVPGKGKYYIKLELADEEPERQSAATVIGSRVFYAAGYNAPCEQVLYVSPSVFTLTPGLTYANNFSARKPYDRAAFDADIARATRRDGLVRVSASAWIDGYAIGPFRYDGTRDDDPSDVVPHEDRRELRAMRLLAAWIERHDAREANSLDTWIADAKRPPDSSPGHVIHYQLDTSEALGSFWGWDPIDRRLGTSYIVDWGDIGADFATLGIPIRPWDTVRLTPGHEIFGYFNVKDFVPQDWKPEYPNAAFSRMTERDAAWMARVLAHFTPDLVLALVRTGKFTDPAQTTYLAQVLDGRLQKILQRYLTRLSPIAGVHVAGGATLCGVDLAEWRGLRDAASFHYAARTMSGEALPASHLPGGQVCVALPHVAPDGGPADDDARRYVRVVVEDGVAKGPLVADLYDLGPARGFRLVALERPTH